MPEADTRSSVPAKYALRFIATGSFARTIVRLIRQEEDRPNGNGRIRNASRGLQGRKAGDRKMANPSGLSVAVVTRVCTQRRRMGTRFTPAPTERRRRGSPEHAMRNRFRGLGAEGYARSDRPCRSRQAQHRTRLAPRPPPTCRQTTQPPRIGKQARNAASDASGAATDTATAAATSQPICPPNRQWA